MSVLRCSRARVLWCRAVVLACVGAVCSGRGPLSIAAAPVAPEGRQGRGRAAPPPTGSGLIAGQVVEVGSNAGTGGIQVILIDQESNFEWRVNADSKGRFFFGQLPARQFAIQTVSVDAGDTIFSTSIGWGRFVTLTEGERVTDLRIGVLRMGSISGVVRDDVGDPVVGVNVLAFQRTFAGGRIVYPVRNRGRTDDRGEYTLQLSPGEYVICACERPLQPFGMGAFDALEAQPLGLVNAMRRAASIGEAALELDDTRRVHAPAFHPAAQTSSQAERVVVGSGEIKAGIDISVLAVRTVRVSGQVVGAIGSVSASALRLTAAGDPTALIPDLPPPAMNAGGQFTFMDVPEGEYTLTLSSSRRERSWERSEVTSALFDFRDPDSGERVPPPPPPPNPNPMWAEMRVSVGARDVTGLVVTVQPGLTITGRVELLGAAPVESKEQLTRLRVGIESVLRARGEPDFSPLSAQVSAEGAFSIGGIAPGLYNLRPSGTGPWSTLRSVTLAGRDMTDLPIEVTSSGVRDLILTFDDGAISRLPGRIVGGRPLAGEVAILVVAFPVDRNLWVNPGSRRFRATGVDQKGAFSMVALPPGDYFVTPIEDRHGVIWQDERNLAQLAKSATTVTISPGLNPAIEIRR